MYTEKLRIDERRLFWWSSGSWILVQKPIRAFVAEKNKATNARIKTCCGEAVNRNLSNEM